MVSIAHVRKVAVIFSCCSQCHGLVWEGQRVVLLDGILIHQHLHICCVCYAWIGIKRLRQLPVYGGLAVVIEHIAVAIRDLADAGAKGDGAVTLNRGDGVAVFFAVRICKFLRNTEYTRDYPLNNKLGAVRNRQIDKITIVEVKIGLSAIVCDHRVSKGDLADPAAVHERQRKVHCIPCAVFQRHSFGAAGRLRPDRVECDRRGHIRIKVIGFGRNIVSRLMAGFCKDFIHCPAEERYILRRGIDGIERRRGNLLIFAVHSLLIDLAVAVPVMVAVHLRCPRASVGIKAHHGLFGILQIRICWSILKIACHTVGSGIVNTHK